MDSRYDKFAKERDLSLNFILNYFQKNSKITATTQSSFYDLGIILFADILPAKNQRKLFQQILNSCNKYSTWGEGDYLPHSEIVDTLGILLALYSHEYKIDNLSVIITRLEFLFEKAKHCYYDTVGFEYIAPALYKKILTYNPDFTLKPSVLEFINNLTIRGAIKLDKLKSLFKIYDNNAMIKTFLNPESPLAFSAEAIFLRDDLDINSRSLAVIAQSILENGSVSLSPATTAAAMWLLKENNHPIPLSKYDYILNALAVFQGNGVAQFYPSKNYSILWSLLPFMLTNSVDHVKEIYPDLYVKLQSLLNSLHPDKYYRVSWNKEMPLTDLDETTVFMGLIYAFDIKRFQDVGLQGIERFIREDGTFFCYPMEHDTGYSVLMHTLLALEYFENAGMQHPKVQEYKQTLIRQLDPVGKSFEAMCHDKWQISWTYLFQRWLSIDSVVIAYPDIVENLALEALGRQQGNGGWGYHKEMPATLEETSFVVGGLTALLKKSKAGTITLQQLEEQTVRNALAKAVNFVENGLNQNNTYIPSLWTAKTLYKPSWIISTLHIILNDYYLYCSEIDVKVFDKVAESITTY